MPPTFATDAREGTLSRGELNKAKAPCYYYHQPNMKAYVHSSKFRTTPGEEYVRDVLFTSKIDNAMYYDRRELAHCDVALIFESRIQIDTPSAKYTLTGFKVEERRPSQFVISVEGPFTTSSLASPTPAKPAPLPLEE